MQTYVIPRDLVRMLRPCPLCSEVAGSSVDDDHGQPDGDESDRRRSVDGEKHNMED